MIGRLLAVLAYLLASTAVLGFLGVGGYRAGFLWLALAIPVAATGITVALLWSADTNRALWGLTAAVLGVVAAAALVSRAPDSAPRLAQRLDQLTLPFFHQVTDQRSGHGWCRPHCPEVRRVYRGPDTAPRAAYFTMLLALRQGHYLGANQAIPDVTTADQPVRLRTRSVEITVEADPPTATIVMRAQR